jgi:hypothetical protein
MNIFFMIFISISQLITREMRFCWIERIHQETECAWEPFTKGIGVVRNSLDNSLRCFVIRDLLLNIVMTQEWCKLECSEVVFGLICTFVESEKLVGVPWDTVTEVEALFEDAFLPDNITCEESTFEVTVVLGELVGLEKRLNSPRCSVTELNQTWVGTFLEGRGKISISFLNLDGGIKSLVDSVQESIEPWRVVDLLFVEFVGKKQNLNYSVCPVSTSQILLITKEIIESGQFLFVGTFWQLIIFNSDHVKKFCQF